MVKLFLILLMPILIFAGRTSEWSTAFTLPDATPTTQLDGASKAFGQFNMAAKPNPFNPATTFFVSGILPNSKSSLLIYDVYGKRVADLSSSVHAGLTSIVWSAPHTSSGLLFAVLRSGNSEKTIKIIILK